MEKLRAEFERDVKNLYPMATLARLDGGDYDQPEVKKCWDFYTKAHQRGYIAGSNSAHKTIAAWRPVIVAASALICKDGFGAFGIFEQHRPEIEALEAALADAGIIFSPRKQEAL